MEFCPNCGSILMPKNGIVRCSNCGFKKSLSDEDLKSQYFFEGERVPEKKVLVTDDSSIALPTTKITCYKCGSREGYWWTLQTRSADEAPTYFIRCVKCGNTWRQSN